MTRSINKDWRLTLQRRVDFLTRRIAERQDNGIDRSESSYDRRELAALLYVLEELVPPDRTTPILIEKRWPPEEIELQHVKIPASVKTRGERS